MNSKLGVTVRRFQDKDADEVSNLICRGYLSQESSFYNRCEEEDLCLSHNKNWAKNEGESKHLYVITMHNPDYMGSEQVEGCGALSVEEDDQNTGKISTFSVTPEYQNLGLGRMVIDALEEDAKEQNLRKVELETAAVGDEFYEILGYHYKNGKKEANATGFYQMEKVLA